MRRLNTDIVTGLSWNTDVHIVVGLATAPMKNEGKRTFQLDMVVQLGADQEAGDHILASLSKTSVIIPRNTARNATGRCLSRSSPRLDLRRDSSNRA